MLTFFSSFSFSVQIKESLLLLLSASSISLCKSSVMQPPPQAVPSGVRCLSGSPQTMFWSNSPYRRQAGSHTPMAPITCPLQPVQILLLSVGQALQSTSLGGSSKSSPPILQGPPSPSSLQRAGLPVPHTNTGDSSQGPCEPLPAPPVSPGQMPAHFPGADALGLTWARDKQECQGSPAQSLSSRTRRTLHSTFQQWGPVALAGPFRRGTCLPRPGQTPEPAELPRQCRTPSSTPALPSALPASAWAVGPGQGGPRPPGQQYWPGPEGPPQIPGPTLQRHPLSPLSSLHQHPGHFSSFRLPASLPGPPASDGRNEAGSPAQWRPLSK